MPRKFRQSTCGGEIPPEFGTYEAKEILQADITTRPGASCAWTGLAFLRGSAAERRSIPSGRRKGAGGSSQPTKLAARVPGGSSLGISGVESPFPPLEAQTVVQMDRGTSRFPLICKILRQTAASMMGPAHEMRVRRWSRELRCLQQRTLRQIGYLDRKPLPSRARQGRGETLAPWSYTPPGGICVFRDAGVRQRAPRCDTGLTCGLATRSSRTDGRSCRQDAARATRSPRERPGASPSTTRR